VIHNRAELLRRISEEADRALAIYPDNEYLSAALMEEVGEFSQAFIDLEYGKQKKGDVVVEGIQVAAVVIRLLEESSAEFGCFEGVYKMTEAEYEVTPKVVVPKMTPELKLEIEKKWETAAVSLGVRPGTIDYIRQEKLFFQGVMDTLQLMFPNSENNEALSKEIPPIWAINHFAGRSNVAA
jgi:hypothetical protein